MQLGLILSLLSSFVNRVFATQFKFLLTFSLGCCIIGITEGGDYTNELIYRVRKVFKEENKTQTALAKDLNVTPAYIWKLLNKDDALPSDRLIDDICEKYKIRKEWLTEGKGDMKAPIDRNDEIARLGADLFKSESGSFKERLLFALAALDESEGQVFEDIANKITKKD